MESHPSNSGGPLSRVSHSVFSVTCTYIYMCTYTYMYIHEQVIATLCSIVLLPLCVYSRCCVVIVDNTVTGACCTVNTCNDV